MRMTSLLWHLSGPVVAAMRVDGNAQPWAELAEVGVCHDVGENASPLVHLGQRDILSANYSSVDWSVSQPMRHRRIK